ncbi:MAG: O-antigen ligase family protein, partial [Anaerolineales bacterium]
MTSRFRVVQRVGWWLWLVTLICLPVTSSPLVARFSGGETPVSPLALLPLIPVAILLLAPFLLSGGSLPRLVWPLMIFGLFTIISVCVSTALPTFPFKGQELLDRIIRGLLTLSIGLTFYLSASVIPRGERKLRLSVRALFAGLILMLVWATIQAWLVLDGSDRVPLIITRIHHIFSVRDPLGDRVTGMAFEPSWLGDQLVVLYIPILLASVLRDQSVFSIRWRRISVELILLVWSIFILLLTRSRISLLSMLAVASIAYFYLGIRFVIRFTSGVSSKFASRTLRLLGAVLTLGIWGLSVYAAALVLRQLDPRMSYLLSAPKRLQEFAYFYPNEAGFALADRLAFAERIAYWSVGMRTFSHYPVLGVGPGNLGFFFKSHLAPYAYQLVEIQNVLHLAEFGFPNAKNLWIRLLAEGGIFGFGSYVVWYILVALGSIMLWRKDKRWHSMLGLAGAIGAITFFIEGFSLDSYALPQGWILFGLITAALSGGEPEP